MPGKIGPSNCEIGQSIVVVLGEEVGSHGKGANPLPFQAKR